MDKLTEETKFVLNNQNAKHVDLKNTLGIIQNHWILWEIKTGFESIKTGFESMIYGIKTHKNPKSGLTFKLYSQSSGPWKNELSESWCMNTSAACVCSAIDSSITPATFYNKAQHEFVYDSIPRISNHKLKVTKLLEWEKNNRGDQKLQETQKKIKEHLKKWYPAIFMVRGKWNGGKNTLTSSQHYMAAVDIRSKNGKEEIFIANKSGNKWGERVPANQAFVSMKQASLYSKA